jgi:hypothetical protein
MTETAKKTSKFWSAWDWFRDAMEPHFKPEAIEHFVQQNDYEGALKDVSRQLHIENAANELRTILKKERGEMKSVLPSPYPERGEMLQALAKTEAALPSLLADPATPWNTLDVDYEPPRVERLWLQTGAYRLYLHRIHPCAHALFHPHPWPSAVLIVSGEYEMAVGHGHPDGDPFFPKAVPPADVLQVLTRGARYEMNHPFGWHSVRPLNKPSLSVMVTGKPFEMQYKRTQPGKGIEHKPLSPEAKEDLLARFRSLFPV